MNPPTIHHILVADDEEEIRGALYTVLSARHYEVLTASNGEEALAFAREHVPDLLILDLAMPGLNGLEVCRAVREWSSLPILILSVRGQESDKIRALDLGADDYITKPFATGELLARVRALLRRATVGREPSGDSLLFGGDLEVDPARRRAVRGGEELHLTRTEFDILVCLMQRANRVTTSKVILEQVWGEGSASDLQTLRVHIANLRKKVEPHPSVPRFILSEPGVGYRFSVP